MCWKSDQMKCKNVIHDASWDHLPRLYQSCEQSYIRSWCKILYDLIFRNDRSPWVPAVTEEGSVTLHDENERWSNDTRNSNSRRHLLQRWIDSRSALDVESFDFRNPFWKLVERADQLINIRQRWVLFTDGKCSATTLEKQCILLPTSFNKQMTYTRYVRFATLVDTTPHESGSLDVAKNQSERESHSAACFFQLTCHKSLCDELFDPKREDRWRGSPNSKQRLNTGVSDPFGPSTLRASNTALLRSL